MHRSTERWMDGCIVGTGPRLRARGGGGGGGGGRGGGGGGRGGGRGGGGGGGEEGREDIWRDRVNPSERREASGARGGNVRLVLATVHTDVLRYAK